MKAESSLDSAFDFRGQRGDGSIRRIENYIAALQVGACAAQMQRIAQLPQRVHFYFMASPYIDAAQHGDDDSHPGSRTDGF
jgi:hypothetical protein